MMNDSISIEDARTLMFDQSADDERVNTFEDSHVESSELVYNKECE